MKKALLKTMSVLILCLLISPMQIRADNGSEDVVEITTIEELRNQEPGDGTVYKLIEEVVLTYQQDFRNQKYIQDETAGILIDDAPDGLFDPGVITTEYEIYDGITGIIGTLSEHENMLQFVPEEDPGDPTTFGNIVDPLVITMEDFVNNFMDYQSQLVTIEEVEFMVDAGETFSNGQVYEFTDGDFVGEFRTTFFGVDYINDIIPAGPLNITGLPNSRAEGDFMTARHWDDIETLTSYSVTFNIIDEEENEVDNVELEFYGETLTEAPYFFEFVAVGTHPYIAVKEGYHTATGQVNVSDDDLVYDLVMVEVDPNMVTEFPFHEDFSGDFPPEHWTHYAYGPGGWEQEDERAYHANTPEGEEADSWLVTPQIQLPEDQGMLITFFENNQFMTEEVYGYSGLMISTGSGNPEHGHFQEIYESDGNIGVGDPAETFVSLGDYEGEVVYLAFNYQGEDAHRWWVDNFEIDEAPGAIEVDNIADLRSQEVGGDLPFMITGEVVITHLQRAYRGQFFIQDESAAIVVDDPGGVIETSYELYDGITGLTGNLTEYANMLQISPVEDPGEATSPNNEIEPTEMTLADITPEHQGQLVIVRDVSFDEDDHGETFEHNTGYAIDDGTALSEIYIPNNPNSVDYIGEAVPDTPKDLIAIALEFFGNMQILPRMWDDFLEPDPDDNDTDVANLEAQPLRVYPNPANDRVYIESNGGTIDQVQVYDIQGRLLLDHPGDTSGRVQLNVSSLSPGIYVMQVSSGHTVSTQKLQIQ